MNRPHRFRWFRLVSGLAMGSAACLLAPRRPARPPRERRPRHLSAVQDPACMDHRRGERVLRGQLRRSVSRPVLAGTLVSEGALLLANCGIGPASPSAPAMTMINRSYQGNLP
jgi:hypothetical protein